MNLYEILQNPDRVGEGMTHFERLFAQKVGGGWSETTITGTPPIYFKSNGAPLTDYTISGNTIQNGTPTPEAPVDVVGCGVRTENVMPAGELKTVESNGVTFSSDGKGKYSISGTATEFASVRFDLLSGFTTPISVSNGGQGTLSFFNTQSNNKVTVRFYNGTTIVDSWTLTPIRRTNTAYNALGNKYVDNVVITVSSGTTVDMTITPEFTNDGVLPSEFEPYGFKLPLTVNGTEYPIYLGQVETTRRIKKLVLTGEEDGNWVRNPAITSGNAYYNTSIFANYKTSSGIGYCTHYPSVTTPSAAVGVYFGAVVNIISAFSEDLDTTEKWKSYLAAQYQNGTPVTVWYVLAEPETGIVNEPLMKIGDYADSISMAQAGVTIPTIAGANTFAVGTTVQPSAISITGNIKPTGYGQLLDVNDVDIKDSNGTPIFIQG